MEPTKEFKSTENYLLWGLKISAGIIILGLLGIHYFVNHLLAPEGLLTYADILVYYQNPIVPVMEIAFLIFVVSHALLGLRSIFMDLRLSNRLNQIVDTLLITVGVIAISYGGWLVIKVVSLGSI